MKLVPAAGGNATAAAQTNSTNGNYSLLDVAPGNYTPVLDDNNTLTDTNPALPPGTAGTEAPNGIRAVSVATTSLADQNFGVFAGTATPTGTLVSGRVFKDDGLGGGVANNGILDGGEVGISSVKVVLQSSDGATTYDTRTTGADGTYSLTLPPGITTPVRVVETNASFFRSTGGSAGSSGGTYSIATDATTFTPRANFNTVGLNFADVPPSQFTIDNNRTAPPPRAKAW